MIIRSPSRDVGQLAEATFARLCANEPGTVANKAYNDQTGWDFLVEFLDTALLGLPNDMRPQPPTAFVQVKGSERGRSFKIKVSNALRFARRPEPCFFVLFAFGRSSEPETVYFQEVRDELIDRIVSRVRQLEAVGQTDLHKSTMSLTMESEHIVALDECIAALHARAGKNGLDYGSEKVRRFYFGGLDDGLGPSHVRFPATVSEDDLIDLALGLRESVPCLGVEVNSERYGTVLPLQGLSIGEGELSITPKPRVRGLLIFTGFDDGDITCDVDIFAPSLPLSSDAKLRIRAKGAFVDLVLRPFGLEVCQGRFALSESERANLDDLTMFLRLVIEAAGREVGCQLLIEGRLAISGSIALPLESSAERRGWHNVLRFVCVLRQHIAPSRHPKEFGFSQQELVDGGDAIEAYLNLTLNDDLVTTGVSEDHAPDVGAQTCAFYSVAVPLGAFILCAQVVRLATVSRIDTERVVMTARRPIVLAGWAMPVDTDPTQITHMLHADLQARRNTMESPYPDVTSTTTLLGPFPNALPLSWG